VWDATASSGAPCALGAAEIGVGGGLQPDGKILVVAAASTNFGTPWIVELESSSGAFVRGKVISIVSDSSDQRPRSAGAMPGGGVVIAGGRDQGYVAVVDRALTSLTYRILSDNAGCNQGAPMFRAIPDGADLLLAGVSCASSASGIELDNPRRFLGRLTANGTLSWKQTWQEIGVFHDVVLDNGSLWAVGSTNSTQTVARVDATTGAVVGGVDHEIGTNGLAAVVAVGDGTIVAGGANGAVANSASVRRIALDGDPVWSRVLPSPSGYSLVVVNDVTIIGDTVVAVGLARPQSGQDDGFVWTLDATTGDGLSFVLLGTAATEESLRFVEPLPDGSALMGGTFAGNLWVLTMSGASSFGTLPTTVASQTATTTVVNDAIVEESVPPTETPATLQVRTPARRLDDANGVAVP
jgi:hypothetical protein